MSRLHILPCLDTEQMAAARRHELDIPGDIAAALGWSAVEAARKGSYVTGAGQTVDWNDAVQAACAARRSIDPYATLPVIDRSTFTETRVQVANETTLGAARRLVERGLRPLALNFANGIHPARRWIFDRPWKMTIAVTSPRSSLQLPIGRRREGFSGHFGMSFLKMPMHEAV